MTEEKMIAKVIKILKDDNSYLYLSTYENREWLKDWCKYAGDLIEKQQRQIEIKDNYMKLMLDILYDYDGYFNRETNKGSITDLADLIDETCGFLKSAIENDDKRIMGISGDGKSKFNILHEKMEG